MNNQKFVYKLKKSNQVFITINAINEQKAKQDLSSVINPPYTVNDYRRVIVGTRVRSVRASK